MMNPVNNQHKTTAIPKERNQYIKNETFAVKRERKRNN